MDHCRTLRENGGCEYPSRIRCKQNFEFNETVKLERTEVCLFGKDGDASAAIPFVGKFGDLSKQSHRASDGFGNLNQFYRV